MLFFPANYSIFAQRCAIKTRVVRQQAEGEEQAGEGDGDEGGQPEDEQDQDEEEAGGEVPGRTGQEQAARSHQQKFKFYFISSNHNQQKFV